MIAETVGSRRIDLDPADWFRAPWRRLPPLPRSVPPPFDRQDCSDRLGRITVARRDPLVRWSWDLADVPPFPQLGRGIHTLKPGEEKRTELTRFGGPAVPAMIFNGILKSHDWMQNRLGGRRGLGHYKRYPEADLTATLREGSDGGDVDSRQALRLGEVDPVVLSEICGILTVLVSKGK